MLAGELRSSQWPVSGFWLHFWAGIRNRASRRLSFHVHSGHRFGHANGYSVRLLVVGFGTFRELNTCSIGQRRCAEFSAELPLARPDFLELLLSGLPFLSITSFPALQRWIVLILIASFCSSDHVFSTFERTRTSPNCCGPKRLRAAPDAQLWWLRRRGIQSAAWTSKVLCD